MLNTITLVLVHQFLFFASMLGFVIFLILYLLARYQKRETAHRYKTNIFWCLIILIVTIVGWGVVGSDTVRSFPSDTTSITTEPPPFGPFDRPEPIP